LGVLIPVSLMGWPVPSYLFFVLALLIIGYRSRFYHPPTYDDADKLGGGRTALAILAAFILLISFIPVPISFS
jgi:hypothetical protein